MTRDRMEVGILQEVKIKASEMRGEEVAVVFLTWIKKNKPIKETRRVTSSYDDIIKNKSLYKKAKERWRNRGFTRT